MLLPRPSGSSLSKILRHKHLLNHLVLVFVVSVPHNIDDVISGEFGLRWFRGRVVLFLDLRRVRSGVVSWNSSGTIAAQMSHLFTSKTLPCFHQFCPFFRRELSGSSPIHIHCVGVFSFRAVGLKGLLPLLLCLFSRIGASSF